MPPCVFVAQGFFVPRRLSPSRDVVYGDLLRLARFLEDEALRLDRTASLLARARGWLRDEHVLAPADSVLRRAVGAARHKARALLRVPTPFVL